MCVLYNNSKQILAYVFSSLSVLLEVSPSYVQVYVAIYL